jgi:hypothetical protein
MSTNMMKSPKGAVRFVKINGRIVPIRSGLRTSPKQMAHASLVINRAAIGYRVVIGGKTAWGGLGNPSGLHDFAGVLVADKWKKGAERLSSRVVEGIASKQHVQVQTFRNITRDRGRWVSIYHVNKPKDVALKAPKKSHPTTKGVTKKIRLG